MNFFVLQSCICSRACCLLVVGFVTTPAWLAWRKQREVVLFKAVCHGQWSEMALQARKPSRCTPDGVLCAVCGGGDVWTLRVYLGTPLVAHNRPRFLKIICSIFPPCV